MAAAKIVGLVVTPTTEYSSTSDCRLPLRMRSRDRSSSHTATPAEESSANFSFCAMTGAFRAGSCGLGGIVRAAGSAVAGGVVQDAGGVWADRRDGARRRGGDARVGGVDHGLRGEAVLLVEHVVGGAGAVVFETDDLARVADELAPARRDGGLDAHPCAHSRREDLLAVGAVLGG